MVEAGFLIRLKEFELSERVLLTTCLLKESIDIFSEDLRKEDKEENLLVLLMSDLESCILDE